MEKNKLRKSSEIAALVAAGLLVAAIPPIYIWRSMAPDLPTAVGATTEPVTEMLTETTATTETTEPTTEPTTETTTEATTELPPESVLLEVPYYSQQNLLPTGCELVSAKMLLEYYTEEEIPIEEIVQHTTCAYPQMIDGKSYAPHPEQAFIGSPWDPTSFGCYAPVIVDMMNDFLPDDTVAVDTSGTELQELAETYLPQGQPVLIWATISMIENFPNLGWYLLDEDGDPTDEWYDWQANEHCLVLVGYDEDYYYFNDPYTWRSQTSYSRELVEKRFEAIGKYSVAVVPAQEE
ncbi:MAG: C39 family peptidase [Oscillospiraceae bacterium]|nr:C39 family peptidase [Oscillospiraceae bacterium]